MGNLWNGVDRLQMGAVQELILVWGTVENVVEKGEKWNCMVRGNRFSTTNFRLFQTERDCRQQFSVDEIGRKFSKWVENIVRKGGIAHYEQFHFFPQCFRKYVSKPGVVWKRVKISNVSFELCFCKMVDL